MASYLNYSIVWWCSPLGQAVRVDAGHVEGRGGSSRLEECRSGAYTKEGRPCTVTTGVASACWMSWGRFLLGHPGELASELQNVFFQIPEWL